MRLVCLPRESVNFKTTELQILMVYHAYRNICASTPWPNQLWNVDCSTDLQSSHFKFTVRYSNILIVCCTAHNIPRKWSKNIKFPFSSSLWLDLEPFQCGWEVSEDAFIEKSSKFLVLLPSQQIPLNFRAEIRLLISCYKAQADLLTRKWAQDYSHQAKT